MFSSKGYQALKRYALFVFKQFYREIIVVGKENLPDDDDDSAVIFAPNHLNALMDALAASYIVPRRRTVVYLARANLFRNKYLARTMQFVNILPAFRMRDGIDNLNKNERSFAVSVDALASGKYLCIMPEGGQGEERKIRPLVKGIFRIAFNAQERFGENKKVKIIPLGLDLGDLNRSNTHMIINIGRAIEVSEYYKKYRENPTIAMNEIRDELHSSLSQLTRDYATSQYYNAFETISDLVSEQEVHSQSNDTLKLFYAKQQTGNKLLNIEKDNPKLMNELSTHADDYKKCLKQTRLKNFSSNTGKSKKSIIKKAVSLLITLPIFLFGFVTNAFPYLITFTIRKLLRVKYSGFISSINFGIAALFFPVIYFIQALLFYKLILSNYIIGTLFLFMQFFIRKFALSWLAVSEDLYLYCRYKLLKVNKSRSSLLEKLIDSEQQIINKYHNA